MACPTLANSRSNAQSFTAALRAFHRVDRIPDANLTPLARQRLSTSFDRLMATPAPNVGGLLAKLEMADQFSLEHHQIILADARRLAGRK